ncbi:hypothetical protein AX17_007308 [Amanita inopinata Kibby_2008]|nr:hypothetical protein AX17_007308 [Amanita inopinata Kibby_2008]
MEPHTDSDNSIDTSDSLQTALAHEDVWEDIESDYAVSENLSDSQSIDDDAKPKSRSSDPISPSNARRRKLHAATTRKGFAATIAVRRRQRPRRQLPTDQILDGAVDGALFTGRYVMDILGTAIHLMRKPLGILIFLIFLSMSMGWIVYYLQKALMPMCFLPLVSRSTMCSVILQIQPIVKADPWKELVQVQTKAFDQLLDESAGGSGLSLEIKKAEIATSDLVTLVRHSELKGRDLLADSLKDFVNNAKKTGRGLQKMGSKVAGAVDNILAVNTYALRTIEEVSGKKTSVLTSLMPWYSGKDTKEAVGNIFADAMGVLSANLQRLILEAETNLANLNSLEERLSTLHDIVTREGISISNAKDDLLSDLWTILGGNRGRLRGLNEHLALLKQLGSYRKKALVHVTATLEALQAMSDDMEDLRERVATPELVGPSVPIEVHIQSIQNGIERLQEGRNRARRIEADAVRRVLEMRLDDNN